MGMLTWLVVIAAVLGVGFLLLVLGQMSRSQGGALAVLAIMGAFGLMFGMTYLFLQAKPTAVPAVAPAPPVVVQPNGAAPAPPPAPPVS